MATLYELKGEYLRLYEMAEEEELTLEDLKDTLESMDGEFEDKAVGYAKVMKEFDAQISAIKDEINRLKSRVEALNNRKEGMKNALQDAMIETHNEKFKTDLFSFNIQNNPPSVAIAEGTKLPKEYLIEQEPKIDKKGIIKALKEGKTIEGCELTQGRSLRIR